MLDDEPEDVVEADRSEAQREDAEEDLTDALLSASGLEPRAEQDIRGWHDLRAQIKTDIAKLKK